MQLNTVKLARTNQHDNPEDAKREIWKQLGDISDLVWLHDQVVVAILVEPEKTRGGIYLTDSKKEESRWQSKSGVVVGLGPDAFAFDGPYEYKGPKVQIGDWVMFRPNGTHEIGIGNAGEGVYCRMMTPKDVRCITPNPWKVW